MNKLRELVDKIRAHDVRFDNANGEHVVFERANDECLALLRELVLDASGATLDAIESHQNQTPAEYDSDVAERFQVTREAHRKGHSRLLDGDSE